MHLRRIEIRNFRKLTPGVALGPLHDGITVISGDNEAGKSTVLAALQTALFEKFSVGGATLQAMMPYASSVRPEVIIDAEIDGGAYRLEKGFGSKAAARLQTPTGAFEERRRRKRSFRTFWGFRRAQAGRSPAPNIGVFPVFSG